MTENRKHIGVGDFVCHTVELSEEDFAKELRLDNNDNDINEVDMITLTKDAIEHYEQS